MKLALGNGDQILLSELGPILLWVRKEILERTVRMIFQRVVGVVELPILLVCQYGPDKTGRGLGQRYPGGVAFLGD